MKESLIAEAHVAIQTTLGHAWEALTMPEAIRKYMFGTEVETDWKEGSSIKWKGEWQGKKYEDKGNILKFEPESVLQYTHFSPLSGMEDIRENYHTVTITLEEEDSQVHISLSQDKNRDENAKNYSERNWQMMLDQLKAYLEDKTSTS